MNINTHCVMYLFLIVKINTLLIVIIQSDEDDNDVDNDTRPLKCGRIEDLNKIKTVLEHRTDMSVLYLWSDCKFTLSCRLYVLSILCNIRSNINIHCVIDLVNSWHLLLILYWSHLCWVLWDNSDLWQSIFSLSYYPLRVLMLLLLVFIFFKGCNPYISVLKNLLFSTFYYLMLKSLFSVL